MPMTPPAILALGSKFQESRVFLTAVELDVFTLLAKNPMSAREIAHILKVTVRGITILLDAVVSMDLLEKKEGRYHCPAEVASLLSKESPTSIMPMVKLTVGGWRRWSSLTDIVRNGKENTGPAALDIGESEQEAFIGAMHTVACKMAPGIVAAIQPGDARKLLDIGGGSGSYTQAFLDAVPGMTATIFDLPPVINIARRRLAPTGLLDRIKLVAGDFYNDELPAGHDLALLSAIIHQNSPEQNLELYRKIFRALLPGGRLVIRDNIMNSDHTHPLSGALFAVNMLVVTSGGGTYSFDEIRASLESAGFMDVTLIQPDEKMNGLVEGFKP
ncbi:MAG: methyltransferase domain-containing protein [Spirochaetes bacterium]|nr:methyltransferase domain-containing protein [Spirochaetota bacterium]